MLTSPTPPKRASVLHPEASPAILMAKDSPHSVVGSKTAASQYFHLLIMKKRSPYDHHVCFPAALSASPPSSRFHTAWLRS